MTLRTCQAGTTERGEAGMSSEIHFLVVDDIPFMRRLAVASLNALGYARVSEAEDGEQALKLLQSAGASATAIDFVVTDWNMPIMDGMALLRTIRASAEWKHLPVLMVSAQAEDDGLAIAAKIGADGYIVKPLTVGTLKAAIDDILPRSEGQRLRLSGGT